MDLLRVISRFGAPMIIAGESIRWVVREWTVMKRVLLLYSSIDLKQAWMDAFFTSGVAPVAMGTIVKGIAPG